MCVAPAPHHTCAYFCIKTCTRLHSQDGRLPLHYAAAKQASEAVVVALLAAHPGAVKEQNRVRQPCPTHLPRHALARISLPRAQIGRLPLHEAAATRASEAVVRVLLAAHPGASKEKDNVRLRNPPRYACVCVRACNHSPSAVLHRMGSCRCTWPREIRRRRRWCWRCLRHTRVRRGRRTDL